MKDQKQQDSTLTRLVGGLAHEIRNPLSTINVNLQLLKEDWLDADTPQKKRALRKLDVIQAETQRLKEILDDFLRYVRIENLKLEPIDINGLLDEILVFTASEFRAKNIDVIKYYDYDLPDCLADANFIKQAFLNIIKNAQQAIDEGGQIMIRTSRREGLVCVEITDTGNGIPADVLEQIFKPYYSTKETGTGLGLPTTKRIIETHGGAILVQSDVGHGTSVIVHLRPEGPTSETNSSEDTTSSDE